MKRICEICGKKAVHTFSPDMDIKGLGACRKHQEAVQMAYWYLLEEGEEMYREMVEDFRFRYYVEKGYRKWARSHTPTFETDNLVHDLMGNPVVKKDCIFLSKEVNMK